jgi:hypothetical protein
MVETNKEKKVTFLYRGYTFLQETTWKARREELRIEEEKKKGAD